MRLAVMTDLHANLEAFEACIADAVGQSVTKHAVLGDFVGYGADPLAVVTRAVDWLGPHGIAIRGNHDAAAAGDDALLDGMSDDAAAAIRWTRGMIDAPTRRLLGALPFTVRDHGALFVHAGARRPEAWDYVTSAAEAERALRAVEDRIVLSGHVHVPTLWQMHEQRPALPFIPTDGRPVPLSPAAAGWRCWAPSASRATAIRAPPMRSTTATPPRSPSAACPTISTPRPRRSGGWAFPPSSRTASTGVAEMRIDRLTPGLVIDGFRLVEKLHQGGMAVIWQVEPAGTPDPGFPLLMKVPLIDDGGDPTLIVGFEVEQMICPRSAVRTCRASWPTAISPASRTSSWSAFRASRSTGCTARRRPCRSRRWSTSGSGRRPLSKPSIASMSCIST